MRNNNSNFPDPFLTLTTSSLNGWYMASCPEFEVSACGADPNNVVGDLEDMIIRNASVCLKNEGDLSSSGQRVKWAKKIIKHKNRLSSLFKKTQNL
ncbi:MAG: hypothetical protein KAV87_61930 [Desulfobacteraceae bacterium]|nr:hypothetical protein [Desulfobacteraceae bacterium]